MNPLGNKTYFTRNFQAVDGWHLLFWTSEDDPGKYFKQIMPGWLIITPVGWDEHGFNGMFNGATPISEREREVHPASVDSFDGTFDLATNANNFYRLLAPGEPEPTEAEALEDWHDWKRGQELDRESRRRARAKVGEQP